jgi:uncharacterized phage-like protein YoqJ
MSTLKICSGGQTGVDRAALDAAISLNIEHGGWCPKGRKAEDGTINSSYSLTETDSSDYLDRTRFNVRDSDATLILYTGLLEGGTKYTYEYANKVEKPVLLIDFNTKPDLKNIIDWIVENNISVLNIAGPRESKNPGIYIKAKNIVSELIKSQLSK